MGSQLDLDQGGTFRQWKRVYLGPSVGWVNAPDDNEWSITAAGTTTISPGTNIVKVNIAGVVSVQLFSTINPVVPAGVRPGDFVVTPLTVMDLGGLASAVNTITILPYGAETIDGLASIQILNAYGAFTLFPKSTGGWTLKP